LIEINDGRAISENGRHQVNCRSSAVSSYVVPYRGHRSAPRMLAALAGFVHHRERADGDEHSRDEDND
jgi:hypothetical protein